METGGVLKKERSKSKRIMVRELRMERAMEEEQEGKRELRVMEEN